MSDTKKRSKVLPVIQNEDAVLAAKALNTLNKYLRKLGMLEVVLVSPKDCIAQKVNARYFTVDMLEQLVQNIKGTGNLESLPLLYQDKELEGQGKFEIVSGHHRIEAAEMAKVELFMALVIRGISREEIISKQLAHNALTGKDDKGILKQLFDSIQNIDLKMASGLSAEIDNLKFDTLDFKLGNFKTFVIGFSPEDIQDYDKAVEDLMKTGVISTDAEVRLASVADYDDFIKAIMKVKKVEGIKSNAVALHRMIQITLTHLSGVTSIENYTANELRD